MEEMIKDVKIVEASKTHLKAIYFLLEEGFSEEDCEFFYSLTNKQYDEFKKKHYGKIYVALYKDKVIGTIQVTILGNYFSNSTGFITDFIVNEKYRRMGIGKMLYNEAEAYARKEGAYWIELCSRNTPEREAAYAFYKALGFENESHKYFTKELEQFH